VKTSGSKPAVCVELGSIVVACHRGQLWEQESSTINNSCFSENSNDNSKLVRKNQTIALFKLQQKRKHKNYNILLFSLYFIIHFFAFNSNSVS